MGFSIKIEGLPRLKKVLSKESKQKLDSANSAIHKAGFFLQGEVKESVAGRRAEHVSVDTGHLLQSVETDNSDFLQSRVFSGVKYAKFIEFGTSKFTARRHFRNSLERNKSKIVDFIKKAIK